MIKTILIILCIIILLYCVECIDFKKILGFLLFLGNIKINIKNPENLKYFSENVIIMSNHYCSLDYCIISYVNNIHNKIYTIIRHDLLTSKNNESIIASILEFFNLPKYLNFILYEKGNKDSGDEVKEKIVNLIKNKNTVLLFPEGATTRRGVSGHFKPGSFKICSDNKIKILPITIEYNKRVGRNNNDIFDIFKWYNTNATLTIHEPVYHEDPEILRQLTYDTIVNPIIKKYKERNIIE
jgi:1-acyl-sn-glycerol-3-phosphate acyltransferase